MLEPLFEVFLPTPGHLLRLRDWNDDVDILRPAWPARSANSAARIGTISRQVHRYGAIRNRFGSRVVRHQCDALEARDGTDDTHLPCQQRMGPIGPDDYSRPVSLLFALGIGSLNSANSAAVFKNSTCRKAFGHTRSGRPRAIKEYFVCDDARTCESLRRAAEGADCVGYYGFFVEPPRARSQHFGENADLIEQQPNCAWGQVLTAGLVAGERGAVKQNNVVTRAGQKQGRGGAGRAGTQNNHIRKFV